MRYFIVKCHNDHARAGTIVRELDEGWEVQTKVPVKGTPGKFDLEGTNVLIPHKLLNAYVTPVNLKYRFVHDDGKVWDTLKDNNHEKPLITL